MNHIYDINKPLILTKLQIIEFEITHIFQLCRGPLWYRNGNFSYRPSGLGVQWRHRNRVITGPAS